MYTLRVCTRISLSLRDLNILPFFILTQTRYCLHTRGNIKILPGADSPPLDIPFPSDLANAVTD
jgi:hypothetical protein